MATNLGRTRRRLYIPAKAFATIEDAVSLGNGAPTITQVTSRLLVGWQMDAAGDIVTLGMKLPFDFEPGRPIGIKLHWTSGSSTAADTIDWIVLYEMVLADGQIPTSISTALDTAIAQDTVGVATSFLNKWTSRGIIDADAITRTQLEAGVLLLLSIEMDASAIDLSGEKVWLLGIEFDYVPRDFVGTKDNDLPLSAIES